MKLNFLTIRFIFQGEINKVLSVGVDPSRIIFANPTKPASHIRHSAEVGVDVMTVDNENELHKIKKLFPSAKVRLLYQLSRAQILLIKLTCEPVNFAHCARRVYKS